MLASTRVHVPHNLDVVVEEKNRTVKWSTRDADLANELAMYHFRELWEGDVWEGDTLVAGLLSRERMAQGGGRRRELAWELTDDGRLSLCGEVKDLRSVCVWVERQTLLSSCGYSSWVMGITGYYEGCVACSVQVIRRFCGMCYE